MFCKKGVLRNFAKFTRKHLCQRLFFNKVAGRGLKLYWKKESLAQVFSCKFCEISKNIFFQNTVGRLLLENPSFCSALGYLLFYKKVIVLHHGNKFYILISVQIHTFSNDLSDEEIIRYLLVCDDGCVLQLLYDKNVATFMVQLIMLQLSCYNLLCCNFYVTTFL